MLELIVRRVETHPQDIVSWSTPDGEGNTFLTLAAAFYKLSLLWPLVRRQPYFDDQLEPIPLQWRVWDRDIVFMERELAGTESRICLGQETKVIKASEATMQVFKSGMCVGWGEKGTWDVGEVARWAGEGADVLYRDGFMTQPLLHLAVEKRLRDVVAAMLTTTSPIDFTVQDMHGNTPLHCVVIGHLRQKQRKIKRSDEQEQEEEEITRALFSSLFQRIAQRATTASTATMAVSEGSGKCDEIDWKLGRSRRNRGSAHPAGPQRTEEEGEDVLSFCAKHRLLGLVWEEMRRFPSLLASASHTRMPGDRKSYWKNDGGSGGGDVAGICLTYPADAADCAIISDEEKQKYFSLA